MQKHKLLMTVIVNEYGDTAGLATVEDLVEEIVGEIYDEFEVKKQPIRSIGENVWLIDARAPLQDVNTTLRLELEHDDVITLNGYLCEIFGEIPSVGREIDVAGTRFIVLEATRERVLTCRVDVADRAPEGDSQDDA